MDRYNSFIWDHDFIYYGTSFRPSIKLGYLRRHLSVPGDDLYERPPGSGRISQTHILWDGGMRLGMPRQEAIREHAHVGVQHRVDRHCNQITREMQMRAFRRQAQISSQPLRHS